MGKRAIEEYKEVRDAFTFRDKREEQNDYEDDEE